MLLKLRPDGGFDTSVYVKPTDKGLYSNFNSHTPEQYKRSLVNSLVHRAFKLSSSAQNRTAEIHRLTQVLVNNGYPQSFIDRIIKTKMKEMSDTGEQTPELDGEDIKFYAELHNVSNFRPDTKRLRNLVSRHVLSTEDCRRIKVVTFYRSVKLSSKFSTRLPPKHAEKTSLVYQFECPQPSCHEGIYIGYTNQKLITRVKQHRWKASPIYKHFMDVHFDLPPLRDELVKSFSVLYSSPDLRSVKIAEAILIKNNEPKLNIKYDEMRDFLSLY